MRISVIGTGYLGAVHAACMAGLGHQVLGVDTDSRKVAALGAGRPLFYEPGLDDIVATTVRSGKLRFSTSLEDAVAFADVHFICVGTPQVPNGFAADLKCLEGVIDALAHRLTRDCLIIGKSTVPVGTAARLAARLDKLARASVTAGLAWNPEFLREGFAVKDTLRPDRLVVGVTSAGDDETLRKVYEDLLAAGVPYIVTDLATAELTKVAANSFLATKISFINALASVCEVTGADVSTLADALGYDARIGRGFLSAGLGFGGGCLGKDIRAFMARADELGVPEPVHLLRQVDQINSGRRKHAADIARDLVGGTFAGRNVAVLGAAFKPGTDDVRDSPALSVADAIHQEGGLVRVHDPKAVDNARRACPELDYTDDLVKACEDADVVLHLTDWPEYREADPVALAQIVRARRIVDARHALPASRWLAAGWTLRTMGAAVREGILVK